MFKAAAYEAQVVNRATNLQVELSLPNLKQSVPACLRAQKVDYVELDPEQKKKFRQALAPVYKKYRNKIGAQLFDAVLNRVKELQQK